MDIEEKYVIQECVICYNDYTIENAIIFDCNHTICLTCYQEMINRFDDVSCPLCRRIIERMPEPPPSPSQYPSQHPSQSIISLQRYKIRNIFLYCLLLGIIIANIIMFS